MKLVAQLLLVAFAFCFLQEPEPRKLAVVESYPLASLNAGPTMVPIRCDEERNIYFRYYQLRMFTASVVKVSRDGTKVSTVSLESVPEELRKAETTDFAVDQSGRVFLLALLPSGYHLLRFSGSNAYEGDTKLDLAQPVLLSQLVALPENQFFVTGTTQPGNEGTEKRPTTPFNAILDASGKLVKDVQIRSDVRLAAPSTAKNGETELEKPVSLGISLAGDDGNLYIMRSTAPAAIFVLSAGGIFLRHFEVAPPLEDATPITFKVSNGQLAVEFSKSDEKTGYDRTVFRVVNAGTGEPFADYEATRETGPRWACYAADGFWFLGASKGKLTRVRALPQ
jgi:hypothetical protein